MNQVSRRAALTGALAAGAGGWWADDARAADLAVNFFAPEGPNQEVAATEALRRYKQKRPEVATTLQTGANVVMYPKMLQAYRTTPTSPLFHAGYFNPGTTAQGDQDGMWLPLDPKLVPNLANAYPEYRRPGDHGVPIAGGLIGLLYNDKKMTQPPKSWAELWSDPRLKRRIVLYDNLWAYNGVVAAALLNGGSESNIEPGIAAWAKHADQILALVNSTNQMLDLLVSGEGWIAPWFKGNQVTWEQQGAPLGFVVPQEGAIAFPLYLQMVAGTSAEAQVPAQEIINLLLQPDLVKLYCEGTNSAPLISGVELKPEMASDPTYSKDALARAIKVDWAALAKNNENIKRLWEREVKTRL